MYFHSHRPHIAGLAGNQRSRGHFFLSFEFFWMCAPLLIFLSYSLHCRTTCVHFLSLVAELDECQVRGRNQRHGHWCSSEHICPPAVHMFTPDPSRVTVWVAPSPFPLRCYQLSHPTPQKKKKERKRFPFLLSRKFLSPSSNEPLHAAVFQRVISIMHVQPRRPRAELPQNSENWSD